ncbi:hypothetical protein BHE74_00019658 [Ensete ventricosum]|nr:hypothetical protein GW17_00017503 [Ensete ventricosum]RWW72531.1 hypothetical protein BHE74_00019658 [Ensete ventricosum]
MQSAALSPSSTPLLRNSKNPPALRPNLLLLPRISCRSRLQPLAAAASCSHGLPGAPRPLVSLPSLSDRRPDDRYAVRATSVPDSASAGDGATVSSGLLQTLQLGSLFGLWYLFNIYFNIYNKQARLLRFPLLSSFLSCFLSFFFDGNI